MLSRDQYNNELWRKRFSYQFLHQSSSADRLRFDATTFHRVFDVFAWRSFVNEGESYKAYTNTNRSEILIWPRWLSRLFPYQKQNAWLCVIVVEQACMQVLIIVSEWMGLDEGEGSRHLVTAIMNWFCMCRRLILLSLATFPASFCAQCIAYRFDEADTWSTFSAGIGLYRFYQCSTCWA